MKKIIFSLIAVAALLTACDPIEDRKHLSADVIASEELAASLKFVQGVLDENGNFTESANGNDFYYYTEPARVISIFTYRSDGSENILATGASGYFNLSPKRGSSPYQVFYVRGMNGDGSVTEAEVSAEVNVPSELEPAVKLLASDAYGSKKWTWDAESFPGQWFAGAGWGNMGYTAGAGSEFVVNGAGGIWWGCPPADLVDQLQHSDTGKATGEEDPNAYMIITEDGQIETYAADGTLIRKGTFTVENFNPDSRIEVNGQPWHIGVLKTPTPAILFPFKINGGGFTPKEFQIMELTADKLKLVYADEGLGGWGEATWWAFSSGNSDGEGNLTDYDTKSWTWDDESFPGQWFAGAGWGNMGYTADKGSEFVATGAGIWWGCPPADLVDQLQHSDTGKATGEEDASAYMTFNSEGVVKAYAGDGSEIRNGTYELNFSQDLQEVNGLVWNYGTLKTSAGAILFPFKINGGGTKPTEFQIMELTGNKLKLVYADEGTGGWGEATWWAFKKKTATAN